jgi:hypothetical protein
MKQSIKTLSIALVLITLPVVADEVTAPIEHLFDAMREHNGDKLLAQFTDSAVLQRAQKDGTVRTTALSKFADAISQSTSYLDEQLLAKNIERSGNLASVWTPYVFYRDKQISHCGVNSFQLIQTLDGWKIHYLIDNVYQGDCEQFIEQ